MWICPRCGEPHQDQFKECWKCVGAEMEEHVTAEPPKATLPPPERRLRSLGSILLRAAVGFLIGMLLAMSSLNFVNPKTIFPDQDMSQSGKVVFALTVGCIFGVIAGLFFWVLFPYDPTDQPQDADHDDVE